MRFLIRLGVAIIVVALIFVLFGRIKKNLDEGKHCFETPPPASCQQK